MGPLPTPPPFVGLRVAAPPIGILIVLAFGSIAVYGTMLAGWSSGSKYPLLGSVRVTAQMISYEAILGLTVVMVVLGVGMAVVGILSLFHKPLRVRLPQLGPGAGLRRPVALTVFGLSYGVASIGCSLPLFIGAVAGYAFGHWIGNVIAPIGAAGAVVAAIVSWMHGRGAARWLMAAAGLLAVSGATRLIEVWITNGTGGVT